MESKVKDKSSSKESNLVALLWNKMYFRSIWVLGLIAVIFVMYLHEVAGFSNDVYIYPLIVSIGLPILNIAFYLILWIKSLIDGFLSQRSEAAKLEKRDKAYTELERAKRLLESNVISKEEYEHILASNKPKITESN